MSYTINIARERFSLWAACRAAQAGSAKARRHELISALRQCGVVSWLAESRNHSASRTDYDKEFDAWVLSAQKHLEEKFKKPVMYGVAAKLISTYLKSAFVFAGHEKTKLATHITPPIDSILLKGVDTEYKTSLATKYKWQKLTQQEYKDLVQAFRDLNGSNPMWHLEKLWEP
jgi:hypothetical protein